MKVLLLLVGGMGFLLYGVDVTGNGLQRAAQTRVKCLLEAMTHKPITAVLLGFFMTALMQSSAAVSVLLVGFVRASLIAPGQAMAVLLGSGVGSTVAVQLIAFRISDYALLLVAVGAAVRIFGKRSKTLNVGLVILGIGFIFYGMGLMVNAVAPLRELPIFPRLMVGLARSPFQAIIASAVFAALVRSAAAVAFVMALVMQGDLTLMGALPLIIGANIGAAATALFSTLGGSREAKRVALANLLFKVAGALLLMLFLGPFSRLVMSLSQDPARQVAHAHTLFNVLMLGAFLPLSSHFYNLTRWMLPQVPSEILAPRYLDEGVLDYPDVALGQVEKEILRMAEMVRRDLLSALLPILKVGRPGMLIQAEKAEETLDVLYDSIVKYLSALSQRSLTPEQSEEGVKLLYISNDLEHVADTCIQIAGIAEKTQDMGMDLSREGWSEVEKMYHLVETNYDRAIMAFIHRDMDMARKVIQDQPLIVRLEKRLRYSHVVRIQEDVLASKETSEIHMDLIDGFLRVSHHAVSIAQAVMGII